MATPVALFRFRIELSDVDRGEYRTLDFRVAQHPSEALPYLLSRVLAYALAYSEGLAFSSGGLSDPDAPGLSSPDPGGGFQIWIEIGNPSARKLHKAAKAARLVKVFTYKDPDSLLREMSTSEIHRAHEIEIYSFAPKFLERIAAHLQKDNRWNLYHAEGSLILNAGDRTEEGEVRRHFLGAL